VFLLKHNGHYAGKNLDYVMDDLKRITQEDRGNKRSGYLATVGMVATYWYNDEDDQATVRVRFALERWFVEDAIRGARVVGDQSRKEIVKNAIVKAEAAFEKVKKYRDRMEFPMENLAIKLEELGFTGRLNDDEMVTVAARKLATLQKMLLASGVNEKILKAVMAE